MKQFLKIALGILSAIGGFVDIGDLVFNTQAGATFGFQLLWWVLPFEWIERLFGYVGLSLLVFAVAAIKVHPDWSHVAHGFVPGMPADNQLVYLYFVVGLLGAALTPYEVYFYSSGAVEDG